MSRHELPAKTIRWKFNDGPMAGKSSFEHELHDDGTITWRVLDGEAKGASAQEKEYAAMKIAGNVYVLSYLGASGHTLTTVLNTDTHELVAVASGTNAKGEKEWFPMTGTFEIVE
ncbi:MAG TPA: MoaF N-terminal domain-containing protein [Thermoanaerobaculia bacterium]|nr:MoaF N-terminal domain-containing protein [Thermoanaerobaculia bacterium]